MSSTLEEASAYEAKYTGKDVEDVIRSMADLRLAKDAVEEQLSEINKEFDYLRLSLIPKIFEDRGITNMKMAGIGRVSLTADLYASIPADKKEDAYQWLSDTGHGDLITNTVNSSTLKAFLKGQIQRGEDIPEDIFKITPFTRASITKA